MQKLFNAMSVSAFLMSGALVAGTVALYSAHSLADQVLHERAEAGDNEDHEQDAADGG